MFGILLLLLAPFHSADQHGAAGEDVNFVQRFIDSDFGLIFATTAHTFGALLFTAGIAVYLFQARTVSVAKAEGQAPSLRWLPLAHILNVAGIGLNGMGGLMRLKQTGHPGLDQLGGSLWVQAILVKHLFLVVGIGLALFLTARTYLMARQEDAPKNFLPESRRITNFAIGSFLTILIASVLGGIASNVTLPGMTGSGGANSGADPMDGMVPVSENAVYYSNSTGEITGTPASGGQSTDEILVPDGASEVLVQLTWSTTAAVLDADVSGPDGSPIEGKKTTSGTRVEFVATENFPTGKWTVTITADRALNEQYTLISRVTIGVAPQVVDRTFTLQPSAAMFAEINFGDLKAGDQIQYEWMVMGSDMSVYFDVHLHEAGQTTTPVQGSWNKLDGTYTHEGSNPEASMLWQNSNPTPLTIHVRLAGTFSIDSEVRT